jgi:hypothetical protein
VVIICQVKSSSDNFHPRNRAHAGVAMRAIRNVLIRAVCLLALKICAPVSQMTTTFQALNPLYTSKHNAQLNADQRNYLKRIQEEHMRKTFVVYWILGLAMRGFPNPNSKKHSREWLVRMTTGMPLRYLIFCWDVSNSTSVWLNNPVCFQQCIPWRSSFLVRL